MPAGPNLPPDAIAAIERGEFIEAIKHVREHTGLGLKEAKDAVDRYRNGDRAALASVASSIAAVAASAAREDDDAFAAPANRPADKLQRGDGALGDPMAEPGRVRTGFWSSPLLWIVLVAIAAIVWRVLLHGN